MNDDVVDELIYLGLTEYEAKIYVSLVGMGEGSARQINEASGVPRPRVYDILEMLEKKGYVEVGQGSPKLFRAVEPEKMIRILRENIENAMVSAESRLKELGLKSKRSIFPIWHIKGEMTIRDQLSSMITGAEHDILILSLKVSVTRSLIADLTKMSKKVSITCIMPEGASSFREVVKGVNFIEPSFGGDSLSDFYYGIIAGKQQEYTMDLLMAIDERRSVFLYESNGERIAVIFELPIIPLLQSSIVRRLIDEPDA
ncbi:MAG: helix-turn-helix domain-containing protein [Methanomassiliicoccales archaeon]|jgi:sugar-specific transcriptional regulator TrmB